MHINIIQGKSNIPPSDINIVIDVIRAFSVSHYAFLSNINYIKLVNSIDEAMRYKNKDKYLLSGEVKAYKIDGFDFGNSPYDISKENFKNKVLIQKTTNGVSAVFNALNAEHIYVTGFTNYYATVLAVKKIIKDNQKENFKINIIASHPNGDDDLACAELIKEVLTNSNSNIKNLENEAIYKIYNSNVAKKFLENRDFYILDLIMSMQPILSNFAMKVDKMSNDLIIKKEIVC